MTKYGYEMSLFAKNILNFIFLDVNCYGLIQISLRSFKEALVKITVWCRMVSKALPEPVIAYSLTNVYICLCVSLCANEFFDAL